MSDTEPKPDVHDLQYVSDQSFASGCVAGAGSIGVLSGLLLQLWLPFVLGVVFTILGVLAWRGVDRKWP